MQLKKEEVTLRLTPHQATRVRGLGRTIWSEEDLGLSEISRRLLLEHLLWAEAEQGMAGKGHCVDAS